MCINVYIFLVEWRWWRRYGRFVGKQVWDMLAMCHGQRFVILVFALTSRVWLHRLETTVYTDVGSRFLAYHLKPTLKWFLPVVVVVFIVYINLKMVIYIRYIVCRYMERYLYAISFFSFTDFMSVISAFLRISLRQLKCI